MLVAVGHANPNNAQLSRFTLDRMITILGKPDEEVEVNITVHPRISSNVGSQYAAKAF
jgi:hypothetical protein